MNDRPPVDWHRGRPVASVIICDVDGTLARRDQPVGPRVAKALADVAIIGWRIVILTGQPRNNVEPRLAPLKVAFRRIPAVLDELRLFTCEGASEWRITRGKCFRLPASAASQIPREDRSRVTRLLQAQLPALLPPGTRVRQPPLWLEDAMCVLKIDSRPEPRRLLADRLIALFQQQKLTHLRVGLGGTLSIVIAHRLTHKGNALLHIVQSLGPGEQAIYLADEFTATGNDVAALQVKDLVCVDFSRSQRIRFREVWPGGGRGPRAVHGWLRRLLTVAAEKRDLTAQSLTATIHES